MNGTLILVGGYWRASKDLLVQVDRDSDPSDRGVDYVIRFKNLPDEYLSVEKIPVVKYHCIQCGKPVPEWEVENKIGCFANHKLEQKKEEVMNYQRGFIDVVPNELGAKRPMIRGAIRLELAHPRGMEIATKIFDYIKGSHKPGTTIPSPTATGTHSAWMIDSVLDIPLWDLPEIEKPIEEIEKTKEQIRFEKGQRQCPHCEAMFTDDNRAERMHIMKKHPEIYEKKYKNHEN